MTMELGCKGRAETIVTSEKTAKTAGSGALDVFATQPYLEDGQGSVGIALNLTHDAATPVGMKVWAESTVTAINGRKVSFSITAYDETGIIGTCDHQRAIIDNEKFFTRCQNKLNH